jgi:serine-type D-Ala-D-Ala carboxypeptidase (penicillin-binding protein 5/6)
MARRPVALLLLAACVLAAGSVAAGDAVAFDRFPRAAASYLVAVNGRPLWARAPDTPLPPASLTKILTALLALENGWAPEAWVTVSPRAARETGARLGLRAGEALSARDALRATLVASANDACWALAEHVAGTAAAFVQRMNRRAAELGLGQTHFQNPCGHDAPGQRSSAQDMWRLTRTALEQPEVRETVAMQQATVTTRGGRTLELRTVNVLLGRIDGTRGVKTGYTPGAGRCIVALAQRGETEVLAVLLDAPDRWWAVSALIEAAFEEAARPASGP